MGSLVPRDLIGVVALPLWGLHMVRPPISAGFMLELNRLAAFAEGKGPTALLRIAPRRP
jgi:hypothetical protein